MRYIVKTKHTIRDARGTKTVTDNVGPFAKRHEAVNYGREFAKLYHKERGRFVIEDLFAPSRAVTEA